MLTIMSNLRTSSFSCTSDRATLSNEHVFRATVYSQALLGKTVCSYDEWCERYLQQLRVKILQQEYPEKLIDEQFEKVRKLDRKNLIYKKKDKEKQKRNEILFSSNLQPW